MHLMTWNINSVRLRLPLLLEVARAARPDVICLQETKTEDAYFPYEALREAGYPYAAHAGEKSYNGVAVISAIPFEESFNRPIAGERDARHIAVRLKGGPVVHNLYVPAGGDVPDPQANPKYKHKLETLEALAAEFAEVDAEPEENAGTIITGDFNVAPGEDDVWSHKQLLDVVSHTPPETERLSAALRAGAWTDLRRKFIPDGQKHYTWWSYRNRDWRVSNRGRRLDHIWCSSSMATRCKAYMTHAWTRDAPSPSDHIPVSAIF